LLHPNEHVLLVAASNNILRFVVLLAIYGIWFLDEKNEKKIIADFHV
jgi:hypothetical protein